MRLPRMRLTLIGLMAVIVLAALAFRAMREWDLRYGRGASLWREAERMAAVARLDRRMARSFRECPRRHSPWQTRSDCIACFPCPGRPVFRTGKPPKLIARQAMASEEGRALWRRYVEKHEEMAREYIADAVLYEQLRRKLLDAAAHPTAQGPNLTPVEEGLRSGHPLSEKYRSDSY